MAKLTREERRKMRQEALNRGRSPESRMSGRGLPPEPESKPPVSEKPAAAESYKEPEESGHPVDAIPETKKATEGLPAPEASDAPVAIVIRPNFGSVPMPAPVAQEVPADAESNPPGSSEETGAVRELTLVSAPEPVANLEPAPKEPVAKIFFGAIMAPARHTCADGTEEQGFFFVHGKKPSSGKKARAAHLNMVGREGTPQSDDNLLHQIASANAILRQSRLPKRGGFFADHDQTFQKLADEIQEGVTDLQSLINRVLDTFIGRRVVKGMFRFGLDTGISPYTEIISKGPDGNPCVGPRPDVLPTAGRLLSMPVRITYNDTEIDEDRLFRQLSEDELELPDREEKIRLALSRSANREHLTIYRFYDPLENYLLAVSALRELGWDAHFSLAVSPSYNEEGRRNKDSEGKPIDELNQLISIFDIGGWNTLDGHPMLTFALGPHPEMSSLVITGDEALSGLAHVLLAKARIRHLSIDMVLRDKYGGFVSGDEIIESLDGIAEALFECYKLWPGSPYVSDAFTFLAQGIYEAVAAISLGEFQQQAAHFQVHPYVQMPHSFYETAANPQAAIHDKAMVVATNYADAARERLRALIMEHEEK